MPELIHWLGQLPALLAEELAPPSHQHYLLSETKRPIQKAALRVLGPQVAVAAVVATTAIESEAARCTVYSVLL